MNTAAWSVLAVFAAGMGLLVVVVKRAGCPPNCHHVDPGETDD